MRQAGGTRGAAAALALIVLGASAAVAQTIELPIRKPGLWELTMNPLGGGAGMTMQHCTDDSTDKQMSTMMGATQEMCSQQNIQKTGSTITIDAVCTMAGVKSTTRSVVTGDFNSAYTINVTSKSESGPGKAARDTTMNIDAKWMGACKSGQKPGDIIIPGGIKINIGDMQKLRGLLPKQ